MPVAYDVAVMGLGAMGSAAAYQLARRGARAVGQVCQECQVCQTTWHT